MDKQYPHSDELTLKELILAVLDYFRYFLRKWYWFLLGAVLLGGLFFWNAYQEDTTFSAPLTFVMNSDKESSVGAGALLGSLGLGGETGVSSAQQLLEMATSRQLLGRVLFDSVGVGGKEDLIANHLIEEYALDEAWEESPQRAGFRFASQQPAADDRIGNSVFKQLHGMLIREEEGLFTIVSDEISGVFTINTQTLQPELSVAITEILYRELKKYYVLSKVSGKQQTLTQLRVRADSIQVALAVAEARLARFQDQQGRILYSSELKGQQLNREVLILSTMYAEIVKNRETTAFLLANEKPAFSLIDGPLEPLRANRGDWKSNLIIGGLLGVILVGIVLFFTKLIGDAMRS